MTYRQAIQKLQTDVDQIYDNAGILRDSAAPHEKETWNRLRTLTRESYLELGKLDDLLSDNRALTELAYTIMTRFEEYAENYNIGDRQFTCRLSGAEVLCLLSLIQLGKATARSGAFQRHFPQAITIAEGLIEIIAEVDQEAAEQIKTGWDL